MTTKTKVVLDHIGIAVEDRRPGVSVFRDALGLDVGPVEDVPSQRRVRAHMVPLGAGRAVSLELL